MIFSRWNPHAGGYDYFDSPGGEALNDDLAVPSLPPATKLGVPSTSCGRPIPAGASHVGSGELAVGLVATPSDGSSALGDLFDGIPTWGWALGGAAAGSLITYLLTRRR